MRIVALILLLTCAGSALPQTPKAKRSGRAVSTGDVWRISNNKNRSGDAIPPWKEIQISNVGFKERPIVGRNVTIIPIDVDLAPFDLRVRQTKSQEGCDKSEHRWEVDLETVKDRKFFEVAPIANRRTEVPFEVVVIYPAVSFARQIERARLSKAMVPKHVALSTVKAAIDLTRDHNPEVLILEYCCEHPTEAPKECDYTCGKTFIKVGLVWKLVDTSTPC